MDTTATVPALSAPPRIDTMPRALRFDRKALLAALGELAKVADPKSAMPVLTHAYLTASTDGAPATLAATDLCTTRVIPLALGPRPVAGGFLLPLKPLVDALRKSKATTAVLTPREGTTPPRMGVELDALRLELETIAAEHFPNLPTRPDGLVPVATMTAARLGAGLAAVAYAMSTDDTRPHLAGALLASDGGALECVATDGHRLILARQEGTTQGAPWSALVRARGVDALQRLVAKAPAETLVRVYRQKELLWAEMDRDGATAWVCSKLVDSAFPAYDQVIPKSPDGVVTVDTATWVAALECLYPAARDARCGVRLVPSEHTGGPACDAGGFIATRPADPDTGVSASAPLGFADGTGKLPKAIGFAAGYLASALAAMGPGPARFAVSGELDPARVTAKRGAMELTAVIMPMRL